MNIKRYNIYPTNHQSGNEIESADGRYVRFSDADELQQRLADAERRNSSLEALLKECNDCVRYGEDFDLPVTTMARIDAALNKPEEAKS